MRERSQGASRLGLAAVGVALLCLTRPPSVHGQTLRAQGHAVVGSGWFGDERIGHAGVGVEFVGERGRGVGLEAGGVSNDGATLGAGVAVRSR